MISTGSQALVRAPECGRSPEVAALRTALSKMAHKVVVQQIVGLADFLHAISSLILLN